MRNPNPTDHMTSGTEHRSGGQRHSLALVCMLAALSLLPLAGCGQGGEEGVPGGSIGTGAGTAAVSWDPPAQNEDGTELTDLAGYKIYYGTSSPLDKNTSPSINVGTTTSYALSGLSAGTYFFAATAYDTSGNESSLSDELAKVITGT